MNKTTAAEWISKWVGPKSVCTCSHTGDGSTSQHEDGFQPGHGVCKDEDCYCSRFTWKNWTKSFGAALRLDRVKDKKVAK